MDVLVRGAGEKYVDKIINGHANRSGFLERKATNFLEKGGGKNPQRKTLARWWLIEEDEKGGSFRTHVRIMKKGEG
jgi:hypothetical protein